MNTLFPLNDYWSVYVGFIVFIGCVIALDLGVFHKNPHAVTWKESCVWSCVWVVLAIIFGYVLYRYTLWKFPQNPGILDPLLQARQTTIEYFTGYILEKALAVDNIFVFIILFRYFNIPLKYQHLVLFYGVLGALFFRIVFISIGSVLMQYHWVVVMFGVFLILTGIKVCFSPEKPQDLSKNWIISALKKVLNVTTTLKDSTFVFYKDNKVWVTPLGVVLIFIELSDIVFAFDSVPAIYAITKEPFIVFTSNVFAILGLRAMYFLLMPLMDRFHLLKYGLGLILVFVGLKMVWLNDYYGGKFPVVWSLGIIVGLLLLFIGLSVWKTKKSNL